MEAVHLAYHYVREVSEGRAPGSNCRPDRLRNQIRALRDHGFEFLTCGEVGARLLSATPLPEKHVTLSFDDGIKDHLATVHPILEEFNVFGTFFVNTCSFDGEFHPGMGFQVAVEILGAERIEHEILPLLWYGTPLLDLLDPKRLDISGQKLELPVSHRRIKYLFNSVLAVAPVFRRRTIQQIFSEFIDRPMASFVSGWLLTADEVRFLAHHGHEIASHSHTHPLVQVSDDQEIKRELACSREKLAEILGQAPRTFGWPSGGEVAPEHRGLAAEFYDSVWNYFAGYTQAMQEPYVSRYDIPRLDEQAFLFEVQ